jgi:hypothetical protein
VEDDPMTYALIIDDVVRETAALLIAKASASPIPFTTMAQRHEAWRQGRNDLGELNRALTVEIPIDYVVTLTHEEHRPGVLCRHVSVGLKNGRQKHGPHPAAMREIMALLGFVNDMSEAAVWLEYLNDGSFAVNALEPLTGDMRALDGAL